MSEESTGYRWQNGVADFLRELRPELVVETGVSEGVSTIRFLAAMDAVERGQLVSIDLPPAPSEMSRAYRIPHPRWVLYQKTSHHIIGHVYTKYGAFDVFIHDSDHDAECQAFEYAVAWHFVKPGGWIISDDVSWGTHGAWADFTINHGLIPRMIGHAGVVQKPLEAPCPTNANVTAVIYTAHQQAQLFAKSRGETPRYSV